MGTVLKFEVFTAQCLTGGGFYKWSGRAIMWRVRLTDQRSCQRSFKLEADNNKNHYNGFTTPVYYKQDQYTVNGGLNRPSSSEVRSLITKCHLLCLEYRSVCVCVGDVVLSMSALANVLHDLAR